MSFNSDISNQAFTPIATSIEEHYDQKFEDTYTEFKLRWKTHTDGQTFPLWRPDLSEELLEQEFDNLDDLREKIWEHADFSTQSSLEGRCRRADSIAFAYNAASKDYNASVILINAHRFLALEGPTKENEQAFKDVLLRFKTKHLVRLTPMQDNSEIQFKSGLKCHPYWRGHDSKKGQIEIATKPMRYYVLEDWEDNQGVSSKKLLDLIHKVKEAQKSDNELIACHCSAGVGRTGTFIAAYALTDMIDERLQSEEPLEISINELVLKLSLQRKWSVTTLEQYVFLYKFAKDYIASKSSLI